MIWNPRVWFENIRFLMSSELHEAARDHLAALGWVVEPSDRGHDLRAKRGEETLVAKVCYRTSPSRLEAAYNYLLDSNLGGPTPPTVRALVFPVEAFESVRQLPISPKDRLKVALLAVQGEGRVAEALVEMLATIDLPRGPAGWRNWHAFDNDFPANQRAENGFYSDSGFVGQLDGLGPFDVINTVSRVGKARVGNAQQVLVLRHTWHIPRFPLLHGDDPPKRPDDSYYDGWVGDEFAALLSLALHVRCMDGGPIRFWFDGEDLDGLGGPTTFWHREPPLDVPTYGLAMLPRIARDGVDLAAAGPLLKGYATLKSGPAIALVRGARQFQQALWIADDSPGLSWLLLVGALEAATAVSVDDRSALDILLAMRPEWAEVLQASASPLREQVIAEAARLSSSAQKVRDLVKAHLPPEPSGHPNPPFGIDWSALPALIDKVYVHRSNALHAGLPFPAPLLDPPLPTSEPPAEHPGGTVGAGDSVWPESETPMYLHVFADVVGHILRSWWRALVDQETS